MSAKLINYRPIKAAGSRRTILHTQFGALCYRLRNDKLQVLLVTSRNSGSWIVPKGWPVSGATPVEAALEEAYEEAGVKGKPTGNCLGIYASYKSTLKDGAPQVVALFPVKVTRLLDDYPERDLRRRKWFSAKKAVKKIKNPELAQLIDGFRRSVTAAKVH